MYVCGNRTTVECYIKQQTSISLSKKENRHFIQTEQIPVLVSHFCLQDVYRKRKIKPRRPP